jgi:hypothetical protein
MRRTDPSASVIVLLGSPSTIEGRLASVDSRPRLHETGFWVRETMITPVS